MKEKFRQFMTGRYGADQLSRFIMACGMVTLVCYMIFRGSLWYYLTLILLVWKNHVLGLFRKNPAADKEHRIYRCPSCKQKVRVPRGKGKIAIVCPKCHKEFIRRS